MSRREERKGCAYDLRLSSSVVDSGCSSVLMETAGKSALNSCARGGLGGNCFSDLSLVVV